MQGTDIKKNDEGSLLHYEKEVLRSTKKDMCRCMDRWMDGQIECNGEVQKIAEEKSRPKDPQGQKWPFLLFSNEIKFNILFL